MCIHHDGRGMHGETDAASRLAQEGKIEIQRIGNLIFGEGVYTSHEVDNASRVQNLVRIDVAVLDISNDFLSLLVAKRLEIDVGIVCQYMDCVKEAHGGFLGRFPIELESVPDLSLAVLYSTRLHDWGH